MAFTEPNGWVDISPATCTADGQSCFFITYSGEWRNIFRYNVTAETKSVMISADFTVLSIYGYKESTNEMYVAYLLFIFIDRIVY